MKNNSTNNKKNFDQPKFIIFLIALFVLCIVIAFIAKNHKTSGKEQKESKQTESVSTQNAVASESSEVSSGANASESSAVSKESDKTETDSSKQETAETATESKAAIEEEQDTTINLGHGLEIEKFGSYTGIYMEDGSDEIVGNVAMILVTNTGEEYIQYAEVTVSCGGEEGFFTLSTLFPGESVVVLEQSRKAYADFSGEVNAIAENVAVFSEAPILYEEQLKVQGLNGALNITNISDKDITETISIYYKNSSSDMLYGGITYRVQITGGLKAGEIKQIISDHFSDVGSRIMFITLG